MSPKDLFPIYLGEIFYKFQRIYYFFLEYFLRYIFVCVNTAIYMSFWGGNETILLCL